MKNLIGQKFHRLAVIEYNGKNKQGNSLWKCICDCGKETIVIGSNLKRGNTKSCGCLKIEKIKLANTTHGYSSGKRKSRTYRIWCGIQGRCKNITNPAYKDYGGRITPITICNRWDISKGGSFENFLEDMGECPKGLTLDRINNDLGYYQENCRWSTQKEQYRNTRNNKLETFNSKTQCRSAWEEEYNLPPGTLCRRIDKLCWSIEKALTTPMQLRKYD